MEMSEALIFQVYTLGASQMHIFKFICSPTDIHSYMHDNSYSTFLCTYILEWCCSHGADSLHYLIIVGLVGTTFQSVQGSNTFLSFGFSICVTNFGCARWNVWMVCTYSRTNWYSYRSIGNHLIPIAPYTNPIYYLFVNLFQLVEFE